ncbi:MAG: response regulator transcription factor [Actinomycetota bacterium]
MTAEPIRIAIADDLDMIRTGFELIIDNEPDMTVVASVPDGRRIVEVCASRPVDLVLMDIRMPELDGLAATERILARPDPPRVVILTTFGLDEYVSAAIVAGASGFLLKDASAEDLVGAVRRVASGEVAIAPAVLPMVVDQARSVRPRQSVPGLDDLTPREFDVLRALAAGRSNAEIGEQLYLSEATVKTHVGRVLAKLGVRDRVQAVIAAFAAGLAEPRLPDADDGPGV